MSELRPPVVAVMGHIDHGKSTLLDYIRETNTTEKEAGGITQAVSAYEVSFQKEGVRKKLTFLDTPGHEAFMSIRERGASAADLAVLAVSAEDGVKPQTMEAYNHIKRSGIPYVVAITKIDKPSANVEFAKQSLAENDIYVEGYGGDVPVVALSSKTGEGVSDLLDMLLLMGELEHCTGDRGRWGTGVVVETKRDPKKGITAVGIIKDGTVRKGMYVATRGAVAPLRFILDAEGKQREELSFSSPIQIIGWDNLPPTGAIFESFDDKKAAQFYADSEAAKAEATTPDAPTDESLVTVPLIVKTDTAGSLDAIIYELGKLSRERVRPRVISSGVGTVSETDVKTALSSAGASILGFNTKIDPQAAALSERSGVALQSFDIIYKLTERVTELLDEKEPRLEVEEVMGSAKVLKLFSAQKNKQVLGARVLSGMFESDSAVRVMRREVELGRGRVRELQQSKTVVGSVSEGSEFGLMLESKTEVSPGDILERVVLVTK